MVGAGLRMGFLNTIIGGFRGIDVMKSSDGLHIV